MADILNTSISGLLAFQRALDTTSHNITNANTVGYSRQVPEFMTRPAQQTGSGWMGNGVDVSTIKRAYDEFLATQSRSAASTYEHANTYATQAERLSNLFGNSSAGLSASLQNFTNALQSVADTPNSIPARQALLTQAQTLIERLKSYDDSLRAFDTQVSVSLEAQTTSITSLARGIAQLNQQISSGYAQSGQPPNDLMDQRDKLIDDLSKHINVSVVPQSDRSLNVFVGNGQPLVVGHTAATMMTTADPFDATRKLVSIRSSVGTADITSSLSGGTLGGMLDFRTRMLDPARNALGRLSVGLQAQMNLQHSRGMDLQGDPGEQFFAVGDVTVQPSASNSGSGEAVVTRLPDSARSLTTGDYLLSASGTGMWSLRRVDTGAVVTMTGSGTSADPFIADGVSIVVSGVPADGDTLRIQPTADAISGLKLLVTNPSEVAAAARIVSAATTTNRGSGVITAGEVTDIDHPRFLDPVTIQFISATQYQISGDATTYTYTAATEIAGYGWNVQISGDPAAGDTFTVIQNTNGTGDNRNAVKLAGVMSAGVFNDGAVTLNAAAGQFVGDIGVKTNQAQITREATQVVADEAATALQSVAGVNLDEEAANLIRYQQAYMAIAQMIRVADTVFQSVLDATRR